jgi:hypothetical protein
MWGVNEWKMSRMGSRFLVGELLWPPAGIEKAGLFQGEGKEPVSPVWDLLKLPRGYLRGSQVGREQPAIGYPDLDGH